MMAGTEARPTKKIEVVERPSLAAWRFFCRRQKTFGPNQGNEENIIRNMVETKVGCVLRTIKRRVKRPLRLLFKTGQVFKNYASNCRRRLPGAFFTVFTQGGCNEYGSPGQGRTETITRPSGRQPQNGLGPGGSGRTGPVSYTHLRAH